MTEDRPPDAHHVETILRDVERRVRIGTVQQHRIAFRAGGGQYPAGIFGEASGSLAVFLDGIHRAVIHDSGQPQLRQGEKLSCIGLVRGQPQVEPFATHTHRVDRQVHRDANAATGCDTRDVFRHLESADHFFDAMTDAVFDFLRRRHAQAQDTAAKSMVADHPRLLAARHTEPRQAEPQDRRHQQIEAVTIGIGLDHQTHRLLLADLPSKRAQVGFE